MSSFGKRGVPPNLPEVVVTDVQVPSHDGVLVPMTILHKQGPGAGRPQPRAAGRLCESYGYSISAGFSIDDMVWIERGGVIGHHQPARQRCAR